LQAARFAPDVERMASSIYRKLAQAEARVHRAPVEEIAFHEVGQIDAIIDVASAALAVSMLGIERVYCSALPCGHGTIHAAHGAMPSPAPATLELSRGVPTYAVDVDGELVTPTGAAILTSIADFSIRPPMTIERIGYGAGRSDFPFPNVLRVVIGETAASTGAAGPGGTDDVVCLETNIDDMNPQLYEHVMDRLFAAGALDAWMVNIQMKKGRPGTQVCVLAAPDRADALSAMLLSETTTLGVRRWTAARDVLAREVVTIETSFGPVRVKVARTPAGMRARPEYDDCRAIAQRERIALAAVMLEVEAQAAQWLAEQT
jgi:pyridinium-3,5-bisthiocarboxylic acid mononucleotide nickel chelatase